jgi:uncharacterized protein YihD (DUF1040 family)
MISTIEKVKTDIENVRDLLIRLSGSWESLDDHEREQLEQVADEVGFPYDIEELTYQFKLFNEHAKNTTVINGVQVYIDDYNRIYIVTGNRENRIESLSDLRGQIRSRNLEPNTAAEIMRWYINKYVD